MCLKKMSSIKEIALVIVFFETKLSFFVKNVALQKSISECTVFSLTACMFHLFFKENQAYLKETGYKGYSCHQHQAMNNTG